VSEDVMSMARKVNVRPPILANDDLLMEALRE